MRRKMISTLILVIHGMYAYPASSVLSGKFPLVKDGQLAAEIVLQQNPRPAERVSAEELVRFVREATGCELPVVSEGDAFTQKVQLFIGHTKAFYSSGLFSELRPEEFVVGAESGRIFLCGEDDSVIPSYPAPDWLLANRQDKKNIDPDVPVHRSGGTYQAVIHFIENSLGGGFLWPGPLGEVIPKGDSLTAYLQPVRFQPPIGSRRIRNMALNPGRYIRHAQELGVSDEVIRWRMEVSTDWMIRRGLAMRYPIGIGHGFTGWWDKYGASNPDLFAIQPSGVRGPVENADIVQFRFGKHVKLCTSNPDAVAQVVRDMTAFFEENPDTLFYPMAINDGRFHGFCMCSNCQARDDLSAEPVGLQFATKDGRTETQSYRFLTDRYAVFWRECATVLAEKFPGKMIAVYAYGAMEAAPVRQSLPSNVVIGFVGPEYTYFNETLRQNSMKRLYDWTRTEGKIIYRPNTLYPGHGLPLLYARKMSEDIKGMYRSLFGVDFDSMPLNFGTQGLNNYVLARLLFNPEADPDDLIHEFCVKAFGPAARHMKRYFEVLEKVTDLSAEMQEGTGLNWSINQTGLLVGKNGKLCEEAFNQAREAVAPGSPEYQRVEFIAEGYRYAQHVYAAFVAKQRLDNKQINFIEYERTVRALQDEFDRHLTDSLVVDRVCIGAGIVRRDWADVIKNMNVTIPDPDL